MKKIAIIPARGGSKRIPRKNIRPFLGKPVIAYSIEAAINSGLFDEVMVSTDDAEIAEVARSYGAIVPVLRSPKNSDDHATTADVLLEVLEFYKSKNETFDFACCLYPVAPFIDSKKLNSGFSTLINGDYDTVMPVTEFSYPIQRSYAMSEGNNLSMVQPEHKNSRSQDLEKRFHDTGQFYWFQVERFLEKRNLITDNLGAMTVSEMEVQDIDTETDWQIATLKFQIIHKDEDRNLLSSRRA